MALTICYYFTHSRSNIKPIPQFIVPQSSLQNSTYTNCQSLYRQLYLTKMRQRHAPLQLKQNLTRQTTPSSGLLAPKTAL